jgi:NADH dehydrogenase
MILLTGGTGYVGNHLLAGLRRRTEPVRVLVRDLAKHQHLVRGNVVVVQGDVTDPRSLGEAMQGVDTVVHLAAIIRERPGGMTFKRVNYGGTVNVVDAAKAAGVKRILHQSTLVARPDPRLAYFDTRHRAEQYVRGSGLQYAILRPSVIFGEGDQFVNTLADLVRKPLLLLPAPIVPVAGDGLTPFSPVWIEDFVDAAVGVLDDPALDGQVYELGGPRKLTYEQILDEIMGAVGIRRRKLHVPIAVLQGLAQMMGKVVSHPPITREELQLLRLDNSTAQDATARLAGHGLKDFRDGIDFVKTPVQEQQQHVLALASGTVDRTA